jgi:hypothetical protein
MSLENTPIGLSDEQTQKLNSLVAQESKRPREGKLPASKLLEAAGFSADQTAMVLDYAAAEGKAGNDFESLYGEQLVQMIQRRESIIRALAGYNALQIAALNKSLSKMRHDLNGKLSIMLAGAELAKMKPEMAPKMIDRLIEQPAEITRLLKEFSAEFEKTLGITRS